jgi:hypothetical protein
MYLSNKIKFLLKILKYAQISYLDSLLNGI